MGDDNKSVGPDAGPTGNGKPREGVTRRRLLIGGTAGAAVPVLHSLVPHQGVHRALEGSASAQEHGGRGGHTHGGGNAGATTRAGTSVDHRRNGFNPTEMLRDFDWGKTRRLASGRVLREWTLTALDKEIEVAPGVFYPAWTYNGRVPGPTLRCREGELLRVHFVNGSAHPHTIHFHGLHPAQMDGVPQIGDGLIASGGRTTYEFDAVPFGTHLYHCHVAPLAEHLARGLYGGFIVDPKRGRPEADEMVMVMNGFNTTFDAEGNQVYAVNTVAFHYTNEPIQVRRNDLVRVHLINALEFDPINSFHIHGNFFNYYPTGTRLEPNEFTDTIILGQAQRGIVELEFPHPGHYMFHSHKIEFADLGWHGFFEVGGAADRRRTPEAFLDRDAPTGEEQ